MSGKQKKSEEQERYSRGFLEELCRRYDAGQNLSRAELRYLVDAGRRALDGLSDPFELGSGRGRTANEALKLERALAVHEELQKQGSQNLKAAISKVSVEFRLNPKTENGPVAKAWRQHRPLIEESVRIYEKANRGYQASMEGSSGCETSDDGVRQ